MRKARTASGATAVQIAHTWRGMQRIIEHLGSAHDEAQLAALVATARETIAVMDGQARSISTRCCRRQQLRPRRP